MAISYCIAIDAERTQTRNWLTGFNTALSCNTPTHTIAHAIPLSP